MDRKLPGDGDLPLPRIVRGLRQSWFDGWYELEIFSDDGTFGSDYPDSLWKLPPRELLDRARHGFDATWRLSAS